MKTRLPVPRTLRKLKSCRTCQCRSWRLATLVKRSGTQSYSDFDYCFSRKTDNQLSPLPSTRNLPRRVKTLTDLLQNRLLRSVSEKEWVGAGERLAINVYVLLVFCDFFIFTLEMKLISDSGDSEKRVTVSTAERRRDFGGRSRARLGQPLWAEKKSDQGRRRKGRL